MRWRPGLRPGPMGRTPAMSKSILGTLLTSRAILEAVTAPGRIERALTDCLARLSLGDCQGRLPSATIWASVAMTGGALAGSQNSVGVTYPRRNKMFERGFSLPRVTFPRLRISGRIVSTGPSLRCRGGGLRPAGFPTVPGLLTPAASHLLLAGRMSSENSLSVGGYSHA